MDLCFATNNLNKLREIRYILSGHVNVKSLEDIECTDELAEDQNTIEGNSLQKAQYIYDNYGMNCFADDTGLEVDAIDGEPGVHSARYAGTGCTADDNIDMLLNRLAGVADRQARFRTVITLILDGQMHQFEGAVKGSITKSRSGTGGFGYDPVFIPEGHDITFAEMPAAEKNKISHRGRAVQKLADFLKERG